MKAVIMFLMMCSVCFAGEIPQDRAINSIIGEAEGEGFLGQLAVACAIRNRGTLKGVYGERSNRVKNHLYSDLTYDQAEGAWVMSAHPEYCENIDGATHWEGTAFPEPAWAKGMVLTATINHQRFYKEVATADDNHTKRIRND